MKSHESKPSLLVKEGGVLALSGKAMRELLQAIIERGVPFRFKAKGFSMSPFIKDGDVITISPLSDRSPQRGDVVAFTHPQTERLTVHRIIEGQGDSYLIKGDSMKDPDGTIPPKNIIGYVTRVERGMKTVTLGLGPERHLISSLASKGLLFPLLQPLRKLRNLMRKKSPKGK